MNTIFLTSEETDKGQMHENTVKMAKHFFESSGFLKIEGAFPKEFIRRLADAYQQRTGLFHDDRPPTGGVQVSDKRYIVPIRLSPPFNDPILYANPLLIPVLEALLGPGMILGGMGAVTALPGAEEQHVHADYRCLFEEAIPLSCSLPCYALTFAIPLIDIDPVNGPTKIWAGSHKTYPIEQTMSSYPMKLLCGEVGSCYCWDYRTFHAGGANHSDLPRSLLYMSYTRSWFKDLFNPDLLEIGDTEYSDLTPREKKLFLSLRNREQKKRASV